MKSIKNYTSSIPVSTTIARIEDMLVEAGARDIHKQYNTVAQCDTLIFKMVITGIPQPLHFKLAAQIEQCYEALWKQYCKTVKKPMESTKKTIREQAARTAWKIIHDWTEIQLTMIQLNQMEPMEAFMTKVYNPSSGETFYQRLRESKFKQLSNG